MRQYKKRGLIAIALVIYLIFLIWYIRLPEYRQLSSSNETSYNYRESNLKIIVYKAHYMKALYEEIAEKHNRLNGTPNKLTLELYFSESAFKMGHPYRTIVFDYDEHIAYIKIENIVL